MEIEWLGQDLETLAHTSRLRIGGKSTVTPQAAWCGASTAEICAERFYSTKSPVKNALVVAGEVLTRPTLEKVGYDGPATDALMARLKAKMSDGRINLVYPRIPASYQDAPAPPVTDLRASALVDIQLEAGARLVIPPLQTSISDINDFNRILERTVVSIQTFDESREIVGHIPTTDKLELVRDMVNTYAKKGVRFFSVDFSSAGTKPALMRTIVRTAREALKIKRQAKEKDEKYYLHVFNVAAAKKSVQPVTPVSDIIIHPYGVDSTSGIMWGGGTLDVEKLRYYNTADYGSYRPQAIRAKGTTCTCPTCSGRTLGEVFNASAHTVQNRLKVHRTFTYAEECGRISERIAAGQPADSYAPYLGTKTVATPEIVKILRDVREVRASL